MEIDFSAIDRQKRYKLLTSLVVPRPIALTTTLSATGTVNAAPFSFFNALGDDPPIVIISLDWRLDGEMKHTERNIRANREFVVNMVDEAIAEKMHGCAVEAPSELSEIDLVGFTTAPSRRVKPPRIAESPVALECKLHTALDFKARALIIGEIVWMHTREGIIDPETLRRAPNTYHPVGRLYANRYCHTRDEFKLDNTAYAEAAKTFSKSD
jgi:flavin reductase (DIM6/NTAB) family NADH-FMN oxidoreductase RutF